MHSTAMPSPPAFLTISSFITSPTLCCPFLPLTMLQSPLKQNAISRCRNFVSSVPFGLLQSDDVTTLCSTGSQQGVDVADTVDALTAAVRRLNLPNVSSSSRDLALVALCFLRTDFLSARFSRRFFRANALRLSLSSRCFLPRFLTSFFRRVGCGNPTTPRPVHRRHCCLLAIALRAFLFS